MQFYVYQIVCYDLQFTSLCLYIRAHFVNIRGAFRTIRARCFHNMRLPSNYQIFRDSENPVLSNMMEKEMKKITIHLQMIIDVCKDMEDIFCYGTLAQSVVTLFAIVSCLYIMSYEPLFSPNFIAQLDYCGGVVIQLTFCCVYGNEITLNAQYVMIGIYESDWFAANTSFKKSMIMNMRRLQKPIVLTIGKFYPLTLTALIAVIRCGFSYFTVLKQTT
ncbi:PREDICTED: putative odorant receptor 71a [Nicrophorus vespilloides]|uniref:Odorant receptor 71a n=1 Tax=Nicrophorus vespilloides TaxID=110193 RepID=A0ABM1MYW6_NICVS|nr:PREDICTED: putative odorant receptor 71a [Nicrophorus vespilloides]